MPKYPKITSNKIKYDSPSGIVNIGKYVPPFEPVKNGYGYVGVILEDENVNKIQCSKCGGWYSNLSTHIRTHNMTAKEYKLKYGLLMSTALKSKKMRLKHSKVMINLRKKNKSNRIKFKKNNKYAGNRKGIKKAEESINKYGVCDLQIIEKVIQLKNKIGKTPTLVDLKKAYGGGLIFHINKRFSGYIAMCNNQGWDLNYSSRNPKYSKQYFIEKALSNEPSIRIFTLNERRALYQYLPGGVKELKKIIAKVK